MECEAWDLLRDFLLLVAQRQFYGPQEELSLLICPIVFEAAHALIQHAKPSTSQ